MRFFACFRRSPAWRQQGKLLSRPLGWGRTPAEHGTSRLPRGLWLLVPSHGFSLCPKPALALLSLSAGQGSACHCLEAATPPTAPPAHARPTPLGNKRKWLWAAGGRSFQCGTWLWLLRPSAGAELSLGPVQLQGSEVASVARGGGGGGGFQCPQCCSGPSWWEVATESHMLP